MLPLTIESKLSRHIKLMTPQQIDNMKIKKGICWKSRCIECMALSLKKLKSRGIWLEITVKKSYVNQHYLISIKHYTCTDRSKRLFWRHTKADVIGVPRIEIGFLTDKWVHRRKKNQLEPTSLTLSIYVSLTYELVKIQCVQSLPYPFKVLVSTLLRSNLGGRFSYW